MQPTLHRLSRRRLSSPNKVAHKKELDRAAGQCDTCIMPNSTFINVEVGDEQEETIKDTANCQMAWKSILAGLNDILITYIVRYLMN